MPLLEALIASSERARSRSCELSAPSAAEKHPSRTYLSPTMAAARHRSRPRYAEVQSRVDHGAYHALGNVHKARIHTMPVTFTLPSARAARSRQMHWMRLHRARRRLGDKSSDVGTFPLPTRVSAHSGDAAKR